MTIERRDPSHLKGVRALSFHARSLSADDDCTADVINQASQWILSQRPSEVVPLSIEFDQWTDDSGLQGLSASEKLLAHIFPRKDGKVVLWHATATVYYEGNDHQPVPPPAEWTADL